jgi:aryl carrier-like protein
VLFSSISSLVPAPGQSSYAAANAFLDALAAHRRAHGLHALAVNWGPWSEAGHAQTEYGRQAHERLAAIGIGSIAPDEGLRVLDALLAQDRAQAAAVAVDWPRLFRADPAAARLGLLADLVDRSAAAPVRRRTSTPLVDTLTALPADERRAFLLSYLSDMVIAALKLRTDAPIDARQRLFDVGLDSILALELKDRLERALGVTLSATLLFVRPTLDALCEYILTDIVVDAPADAPAVAAPAVAAPVAHESLSEDELTRLLLQEIDASRGA